MRSRLRLIGKKIALARRLVSLLTCTQHLRLKYRIRRPRSLLLFPRARRRAALSLSLDPLLAPPPPPCLPSLLSLFTAYRAPTLQQQPPPSCLLLRAGRVFFRLWPVHQPFLHDLARWRNSRRHCESRGSFLARSLSFFLSHTHSFRDITALLKILLAIAAVVPRGKLSKTLFLER